MNILKYKLNKTIKMIAIFISCHLNRYITFIIHMATLCFKSGAGMEMGNIFRYQISREPNKN